MTSKLPTDFAPFALRALMVAAGCLGLAWGASNLARGAAVDQLQTLEARLLQFETFKPAAATGLLQDAATWSLSACDNHAQRALLLLEMPLTDASLRVGTVTEFDRHLQSIENRARQVLACAPRDPLAWVVMFGLEVEYGRLDDHTFDLLAASYEISPNEAWVAIRRTAVAVPVVMAAPAPIQQQILFEFQNLVRHRFVEVPARSYLGASDATRGLLQSRIDELDPASRRAFSDALQKFRS